MKTWIEHGMMNRGRSLALALALALPLALAVTACETTEGPLVPLVQAEAEVQRALCERVFSSCSCEQWSWYEDEDECNRAVSIAVDEIRETFAEYPDLELYYDAACMGSYVEQLDTLGCSAVPPTEPECERECPLIYGTRGEGEGCEIRGNDWGSDCAKGLRCDRSSCKKSCEADVAESGQSCFDRPCAEGLVCNFERDVCERAPEVGEPCPFGTCEPGAFCEAPDPNDPTSTAQCAALRELGETCRGHLQCVSGHCPNGFCAPVPGPWESCANVGLCEPGYDCVEQACVPSDPVLCEVGVQRF